VKNAQSKLALLLAAKYKHVPHRLILSGTPLQKSGTRTHRSFHIHKMRRC
jgi:SNF2 family DNA or RNA helicase